MLARMTHRLLSGWEASEQGLDQPTVLCMPVSIPSCCVVSGLANERGRGGRALHRVGDAPMVSHHAIGVRRAALHTTVMLTS